VTKVSAFAQSHRGSRFKVATISRMATLLDLQRRLNGGMQISPPRADFLRAAVIFF
jgi:hypothetical protein